MIASSTIASVQAQYNISNSVQPTFAITTNQGSENNVVGEWTLYMDDYCNGSLRRLGEFNLKGDGTFVNWIGTPGTWIRTGNKIQILYNTNDTLLDGTIKTNDIMTGTFEGVLTGCWLSYRVGISTASGSSNSNSNVNVNSNEIVGVTGNTIGHIGHNVSNSNSNLNSDSSARDRQYSRGPQASEGGAVG